MASNVNNCTVSRYVAVETANDAVSTGSLPSTATMTIIPDNGYILRARDFNISGGDPVSIIATAQSSGGCDTVLFEKGTPGVVLPDSVKSVTFNDTVARAKPDNLVTVTVNFEDDYVMPNSDTTINIDINGGALSQSWREIYVKIINTQSDQYQAPSFVFNTPELDPSVTHYNVTFTTNNVTPEITEYIISGFINTDSVKLGTLTVSPNNGFGISLDNHTSNHNFGWYQAQQSVNVSNNTLNADGYYTSYSYDVILAAGPNDIPSDWEFNYNYNWGDTIAEIPFPVPNVTWMSFSPFSGLLTNDTLVMNPISQTIELCVWGDPGATFNYSFTGSGDSNAAATNLQGTISLPNSPLYSDGSQYKFPITIPANTSGNNNLYQFTVEPAVIQNYFELPSGYPIGETTTFSNNFGHTTTAFGEQIFNFTQVNGITKVLLSHTATGNISLVNPQTVLASANAGTLAVTQKDFTWQVSSSSGNLAVNGEASGGTYVIDTSNWSNTDAGTNGDSSFVINATVTTFGNTTAKIIGTLRVFRYGVEDVTSSIDINNLFS